MKKNLSVVLIVLALAMVLTPAVLASEENYPISDKAGLLTDAQWMELNDRAEIIAEKYRCEVVVVTVRDMADYGHNDIYGFNRDVYQEAGYGYGPDKSCLILCLSMADRDYWLEPYGYAKTAFTTYGIDEMLDRHVLPQLKNNNYYEAFSKYLDKADEYLKMARDGAPFDRDTDPANQRTTFLTKLAVVILLPALIAFIICAVWKYQMKTARLARAADNYIPEGGFRLTAHSDMFLYRTTTQIRIEKTSSSSSGSSSSGRGGKF